MEQLVIIQKKAAVFLLRHKNTEKHELIEKTAQYFEREINGEAVSSKEWGDLVMDQDQALAQDWALAMDLAQALAQAQGQDLAQGLAVAQELAVAQGLAQAQAQDLVDFLIKELGDFVPTLTNPDQFILDSLSETVSLDMLSYHTECGTTHCRAGFIEMQAGEIGKTLVKYFNNYLTGAMLYKKATGDIPNFFASNREARESIRRGAANWKPVK